jgi:hypothetical protein
MMLHKNYLQKKGMCPGPLLEILQDGTRLLLGPKIEDLS